MCACGICVGSEMKKKERGKRERGRVIERREMDALSACGADAVSLGDIKPSVRFLQALSKFWQARYRRRQYHCDA